MGTAVTRTSRPPRAHPLRRRTVLTPNLCAPRPAGPDDPPHPPLTQPGHGAPGRSHGTQDGVDRLRLGRIGEDAAVRYLEARGYRIVARNFRCPLGEI
ncbi:MAG: YraN family protein, partial [Armatimonadota bacterium]|nr:YraN family protein [Armatimonadota bacterium]